MRVTALAILALSACGSTDPTPAAPAAEHISPPFSAADLRAGLPVGTEIKLRIEAAGKPPVIQHWTFTAADERGCTIAARILDDAGNVIKDEGAGTSTWEELESHGRFPAARTTMTESSVEVPAGRFATWLFEVKPAKPGDPLQRLHFARDFPGPPVSMEVIDDGAVVLKLVMIERKPMPR